MQLLSEPQDGRKVADGGQERRSGRRSRWEAHKALRADWDWDCKGAKACSAAKAHPGRLRGAAKALLGIPGSP